MISSMQAPGGGAPSKYDVVVVGSGAGGAAAAYRLVRAGLSVLLVEKGEKLPTDGSTLSVQKVIRDGAFKSAERWRDRHGRELAPEEHFNVGGKTKWYGAALARFGAHEFAADPAFGYLGWPIAPGDLEPYYAEIESLLGVRGVACEPDLERLLAKLGAVSRWRSARLPMGLSPAIDAYPEEARHFDGFASPRGLKSDAEIKLLERIAQSPNFTLVTGCSVAALVPDVRDARRVAGVQLDDGSVVHARETVLAAGAMHSPRLVQRYLRAAGLERLPIARVAGGNFKLHLLTAVLAFAPRRQTDSIRKTTLLTHPRVPHSSVQPLGFDGELIATLLPRAVPRVLARVLGEHAYGFFLQTEDGSSLENRVVDAGERALPLVDYDERRVPAAAAEHRLLVQLLRRDLLRAGYVNFARRIGIAGTAHACGTLVCGRDPAVSAVDAEGRVHGLGALTVVDGSVLPRSSSVNPALTIYAWSLRAAAALALRLEANGPAAAAPDPALAASA